MIPHFLIKDGELWISMPVKTLSAHLNAIGAACDVVAKKDTKQSTDPTEFKEPTESLVVESNITYNQPFHGAFYDQERNNEWYWK